MYITPRLLINQEFTQIPVYGESPLSAFVIGPNYNLARYNIPAEKSNTTLATLNGITLETGNSYVYTVDTTYDIPNIPVGGVVDSTYTKVYAENVEAQYFPLADLDSVGQDEVIFVQGPTGANLANKIRFTGVTLKTANGYARSSAFSGRDVAVGDLVKVTDDLGNTVKAKITALQAEAADVNEDLVSQIAPEIASGNDGQISQGSTFTSASASFVASEVIGKYITIQNISGTAGVFKILDCPDSNTLTLNTTLSNASSKTWYVGGVYNSVSNSPKQAEDYSGSVSGTSNTTLSITNTSTAYRGYASKGIISDVYTVEVTTAGDLDAVRFAVSSQNGAFSAKTGLSLDGGVLTVDDSNNNDITIEFADAVGQTAAFAVGNSWSLSVTAPVNPVNPVTSGEYAGSVDMVYTLRVDRGGPFFDGTNSSVCARVVITSSDLDRSSAVLPTATEYFSVGNYGVTASFLAGTNNGGLVVGDVYYIPVAAEKKGPVTIVELSEALPEATLNLATELTAELFLVQKSIQISSVRDLLAQTQNWTQEDSYITINAGITTYDNALVAAGSVVELPVKAAKLFVEHRDLLNSAATSIESISSLADVATILGTVHPDNPLAQGVYDAILNSQNQIVYYAGVATDDLAGYTAALKLAEKNDKVYSVVPLTFDKQIQDAVVSHVNALSTAEEGKWRIAWLSVADQKQSYLYDLKEDSSSYTATITDDPSVSGTQYRLVTVADAMFIDDGVRAGDSVRINFSLDSDGKTVFEEYFVQQVKTNTTLVLQKSLTQPINNPTKVQIVRNYTKSERAANIAAFAAGYNNRRVRVVFPDSYKYGSVTKQGYFAAAGLAGLRSGVVPHQGLTGTEFLGADDLSKVVTEFNQDDLDTMAEQGVWLLAQESATAKTTPYVRHQLTSATESLNTSEDSITTNVDSISYGLKSALAPFIGRYNVNPDTVDLVRVAVSSELSFRALSTRTARAGNQLTSFTPATDIIRIQQDATFKDRIVVDVRLNVPYPMNYINLTLFV
jgi:hypothetical protein